MWEDIKEAVRRTAPESVDAAMLALWAFLVGRIELAKSPVLSNARFDAGLDDAVCALMTGFRAKGPVASPLPKHLRRRTDE